MKEKSPKFAADLIKVSYSSMAPWPPIAAWSPLQAWPPIIAWSLTLAYTFHLGLAHALSVVLLLCCGPRDATVFYLNVPQSKQYCSWSASDQCINYKCRAEFFFLNYMTADLALSELTELLAEDAAELALLEAGEAGGGSPAWEKSSCRLCTMSGCWAARDPSRLTTFPPNSRNSRTSMSRCTWEGVWPQTFSLENSSRSNLVVWK